MPDLPVTMRGEIRRLGSAAVLLALAALPLPAQEPVDEETQVGNIHFAFATYLGSGIYSVEDRTVQVYRLPVTVGIVPAEGRDWGMHLQIPATFGFYDFEAEDVLVVGLPDRVSTFCIVPSLRAPVRVTERWTLTPNADFGAAKEFDQGDVVWVFGLGLQADAVYPMTGYDLRPLLRGVWAHHTGEVYTIGNDMAKFEIGLEIRSPPVIGMFGRQFDLGFFWKHYSYVNEVELVQPDELPMDFTSQWEAGFAIGTEEPFAVLKYKFKLPRIGLSYRFGDNVGAVRIILGKPM